MPTTSRRTVEPFPGITDYFRRVDLRAALDSLTGLSIGDAIGARVRAATAAPTGSAGIPSE
ncbi:hypothetical protein Drose_00125 [Dactylosporangium roseum]|uniref:Uncharacterized protein n=1 Tax=Dactylosporangium roseum TaxID=47989 RepID=A0ABY5Z423_9ACTN|nr:hypothetical protein [Dactylosporangium roseum]UWZ36803.1 hypothetical protein Drose_00125 [Dactylosporangium roseum]